MVFKTAEWSEPVQITQGIDVFSVQFISDEKLLFTGNESVFIANADGSDQRIVLTDSRVKRATLSPDGKTIIFDNDFDIYMADVDGTYLEAIANDSALFEFGASFSSNGEEITYITIDDKNKDYGIWVMNVADRTKQNILASNTTPLRHARWNPDRTELSYFWIGKDGTSIISVLTGSEKEDLTASDVYSRQASWSPDGEKIVYSAMKEEGDFDLWIMDADGSNKQRITSLVGDETKAVWSPDGQKITFVCSACRNSKESDIYLLYKLR